MIRIRKSGSSVIASFATPQEIVIDHANDSIRVGDGTDLVGVTDEGGEKCLNVRPYGAGDASAANQTSGDQKTQITDSLKTDVAEIDDVAGEKALKVSVVATVGGGSAPSYQDDDPFTPATDSVSAMGALFDDVATDSVDEGDIGILRMTADRLLKIQIAGITGTTVPISNANIDAALSTLATATKQDTQITSLQLIDDVIFVDDAAYTAATHKLAVVGGQYQATPNALDDGDAGTILLDANHAVQVVLRAGTAAIGKLAANSGVDIGDVDVTSCALPTGASTLAEQQTQTTALQLIDDVIFVDDAAYTAATHKLAVVGGQYQSTPNALDDGDAGTILLDANHAVQVVLRAGTAAIGKLAANSGVDIGDVDVTSVAGMPTGTNSTRVQGTAAVDAAIVGDPVIVGGSARLTTLPTAVGTADDVTKILTDPYGRVMSCGFFPPGAVAYQTSTITNTTETTIVTADANNCLDIICMTLTNNSDVQSTCDIRDSTTGTVRLSFVIPARGGIIFMPSMPLCQTTKNNNWTVDQGTTGTATAISVYYGKRPT